MCNILVQILLKVLQRAGWRLKWAGWRWVELDARFSNTHSYITYIWIFCWSTWSSIKDTSTDTRKTLFREVLFMWSSMPLFSFIGYILTELFRKPDNWRQTYKQMSSTFYTSNDVSRRKNYQYVTARLRNSCCSFFKKKTEAPTGGSKAFNEGVV